MLFIAQYQAERLTGTLTNPPHEEDARLDAATTPYDDPADRQALVTT